MSVTRDTEIRDVMMNTGHERGRKQIKVKYLVQLMKTLLKYIPRSIRNQYLNMF
jgi:hypothetical protein